MTGNTTIMTVCMLAIIGVIMYQTTVIVESNRDITAQHAVIVDQHNVITSKLGMVVLAQILTEDQKHNLPLMIQDEVKAIITENARMEAIKAKGAQP